MRNPIYAILFLGLALRAVNYTQNTYGVTGELYRDLNVVYDFLINHTWPQLGPSSSLGGFNFGAIYYYLIAPFVYIFHFSSFGATVASTFFSVLSIWMLYKLLLLWFKDSPSVANWGAFLLSVSLLDIQYSYYVSNPNLMPFFILGFLYFLTLAIEYGADWKNVLGLALCFGILTQLHATALLLFSVVLIASIVITRTKVKPAKALLFAAVCLVLYLPGIVYEFSHNFVNSKGIFHLGGANYGFLPQIGSLSSLLNFWDSLFVFKDGFYDFFVLNQVLFYVFIVFHLAVLAGVYFWHNRHKTSVSDAIIKPGDAGRILLLIWLFAGSLMFLFFKKPIQYFYFLSLWPLPIIIFAWFLVCLKARSQSLFKVVLCTYVLFQIVQLGYLYVLMYRPVYSFGNINQAFKAIKTAGIGRQFSVLNYALDPNQFSYFMRITNLNSAVSKFNAQYIYIISNKDFSADSLPALQRYMSDGVIFNNGIRVEEYER